MIHLKKDPEQIKALRRRMEKTAEEDPRMGDLYDVLLGIAGFAATADLDPDVEKILERGRLFGTRNLKTVRGRASACHENAARLWMCNRDKYSIVTGWAMSDDGIWRQHSWVIDRSDRVIETTLPRIAYYGADLDPVEAVMFALAEVRGKESVPS
jgi:hypothetical protein